MTECWKSSNVRTCGRRRGISERHGLEERDGCPNVRTSSTAKRTAWSRRAPCEQYVKVASSRVSLERIKRRLRLHGGRGPEERDGRVFRKRHQRQLDSKVRHPYHGNIINRKTSSNKKQNTKEKTETATPELTATHGVQGNMNNSMRS